MTSGLKARAGGRCFLLFVLTALCVPTIGAAAAGDSTLVPPRAAFEESLGIAPAADAPQAIPGPACVPDTGTPTASTSSADIAIGPAKGVIVTSEGFAVFTVANGNACASVSFQTLASFFGTLSPAPPGPLLSPRVAYNPHVGRFLIMALARDSATGANYLYLAISTNDTASSWSLAVSLVSSGDYALSPTLGFSAAHWLVTMKLLGSGGSNSILYRIAATDVGIHSTKYPLPANTVAPRIMDTSTTAYLLAIGGSTSVTRIQYDVTTNTTSATPDITIPAFTAPPPVVQKNGRTLNPGDGNFLSPSIQIGSSLWNVHTVNVDGHARARLYKFSTTGTTPLMTFTPTTSGADDIFNAAVTTGSEAAGSRAFISATLVLAALSKGQGITAFSGPNNSTQGWSYDVLFTAFADVATSDGINPCPSMGCTWVQSSGAAMVPGDTTTAWVFSQYAKTAKQTDWGAVGYAVSGAGTGTPPLAPIASAATDVTDSGFTANWSAQPPAVGYQLDVAPNSTFTTFVSGYQARDVGNVTSFAVTGLDPDTGYFYRVRAVAAQTSLNSNTIGVTTDVTPPSGDPPPNAKTAIGPFELAALFLLTLGGLGSRLRRA